MKKILVTASILLVLAGCYNDKSDKLYPPILTSATTCDTNTTISYAADVSPIIVANCYNPSAGNCHNATGSSTSGYNYEVFSVIQGNALNGYLLSDINWAPTRGHNDMPLNGTKLSSCDIDKITRWVSEGAPNN